MKSFSRIHARLLACLLAYLHPCTMKIHLFTSLFSSFSSLINRDIDFMISNCLWLLHLLCVMLSALSSQANNFTIKFPTTWTREEKKVRKGVSERVRNGITHGKKEWKKTFIGFSSPMVRSYVRSMLLVCLQFRFHPDFLFVQTRKWVE